MESENNSQTPVIEKDAERTAPELDTRAAQPEDTETALQPEAESEALTDDRPAEKKPGPLRRFFGAIGHWVGRHKILAVLLALLIAGGLFAVKTFRQISKAVGNGYSFVRTTTLKRTTLQNSVTATGTVKSANVSNVTTTKTYAVSAVNVQVGDIVAAGDVIATLDSTDLESQIARKQDSIDSQTKQLNQSNTKLYQSYTDAQDDLAKAQKDLTSVQSDFDKAQSDYDDANDTYKDARDTFHDAESMIDAFTAEANAAEEAMQRALSYYNDCKNAYDKAKEAYESFTGDEAEKAILEQAKNDAESAQEAARKAYEDGDNSALALHKAAQEKLTAAQSSADYTNAKTAYDKAITARDSAQKTLDSAQKTLDTAKEKITTCQKSVTRAYENYQAGSTSNTLDTLREDLADLKQQLADCTLVAETSGTVTALNATVGSSCQGTVATIQDVNNLKIAITLHEYDVTTVTTGMQALITSDATTGTIYGNVTQIDPTSTSGASTSTGSGSGSSATSSSTSSAGTFGAEVTVDGGANGLLIGMNANVEIVKSSTDNVFVVPQDAVGTEADGSQYVYKQTGGSGADMTFDKVTVITGESNDYYTEVSGAELAEGDVIRSTADLSLGLETVDVSASGAADSTAADANAGGGRGNRDGGTPPQGGGGPGGM